MLAVGHENWHGQERPLASESSQMLYRPPAHTHDTVRRQTGVVSTQSQSTITARDDTKAARAQSIRVLVPSDVLAVHTPTPTDSSGLPRYPSRAQQPV